MFDSVLINLKISLRHKDLILIENYFYIQKKVTKNSILQKIFALLNIKF